MAARPELPELQEALSTLSWEEFQVFAIHLGLDLQKLKKIEEERSATEVRVLHSMQAWLNNDAEVSWDKIVRALQRIEKNEDAKQISSKHCPYLTFPSNLSSPTDPLCQATQTAYVVTTPQPEAPIHSTENQPDIDGTSFAQNQSTDQIRTEKIATEAAALSNRFMKVLTKAKIQLFKKESESTTFLTEFCTSLTTLPLSTKYKHLQFLKEEKPKLKVAKDVDEIFDILEPYLSHTDYALLNFIISTFCDEKLNQNMKKYISELEIFEKATTVHEVQSTRSRQNVPNGSKTVVLCADIDPKVCSLYTVRKMTEAIADEAALEPYTHIQLAVYPSSVTVVLGFPESTLTLVARSMTTEFLKTHRIVSVSINEKTLEVYNKEGQNLLAACGAGNTTAVIILLQRGTDVHFIGNNQKTALDCAHDRGCHEIVRLLRKQGACSLEGDDKICSDSESVMDPYVKLGDTIPEYWHFRLDPNNKNLFQPQEWVAYEIHDGVYVVAQVVYPVSIKEQPMQMEYVIFTSEKDKEGKVVKAIDLFKFFGGKKQPEFTYTLPTDPKCQELVPFKGHSELEHTQDVALRLQQAKDEIQQELQVIWEMPGSERRRYIRRLYLKWHPDKLGDEISGDTFKYIQEQLKGKWPQDDSDFKQSDTNTEHVHREQLNLFRDEVKLELQDIFQLPLPDRKKAVNRLKQKWHPKRNIRKSSIAEEVSRFIEEELARLEKDPNASSSVSPSRKCLWSSFFVGSFTPMRNIHEAKRWVRQAEVDCKAVNALLRAVQENDKLSSHVCFMAHEVVEKALKGGMYATCGLGENSLRSHKIVPLARSLEVVVSNLATGLSAQTTPLQHYYLDSRFPKHTLPSESYTVSTAENAAECAKNVLKIMQNIVHT